jgi:signal recognition particle subunit SEC65
VKDPKLDELVDASKRLGFAPEVQESRHPLRMMIKSGYVSVEKKGNLKKVQLIDQLSKTLSNVRGERSAAAAGTEVSRGSKTQPGSMGKKR